MKRQIYLNSTHPWIDAALQVKCSSLKGASVKQVVPQTCDKHKTSGHRAKINIKSKRETILSSCQTFNRDHSGVSIKTKPWEQSNDFIELLCSN